MPDQIRDSLTDDAATETDRVGSVKGRYLWAGYAAKSDAATETDRVGSVKVLIAHIASSMLTLPQRRPTALGR